MFIRIWRRHKESERKNIRKGMEVDDILSRMDSLVELATEVNAELKVHLDSMNKEGGQSDAR